MTLEGQNLSVLNVNKNDIYYNCIAIICHVGHDLSSGHYEAFTFEKHKWMLYSDLMRQHKCLSIKNIPVFNAKMKRNPFKFFKVTKSNSSITINPINSSGPVHEAVYGKKI